jgi:hypothetical protein
VSAVGTRAAGAAIWSPEYPWHGGPPGSSSSNARVPNSRYRIITRVVPVPAAQGTQYRGDVFSTATEQGHQAEHERGCGHYEADVAEHRTSPQFSGVASRIASTR